MTHILPAVLLVLGGNIIIDFNTYKALKLYKPKAYSHFDESFGFWGEKRAYNFVSDPQNVASHAFHPFMAFNIENRRFRKGDDGSPEIDVKVREIRYAAHKDGYIYSYYSFVLNELYEQELVNRQLDSNVIAYRSVEKKCNIDFANEAFQEIAKRKNCLVIALDFSKFFETICHENLKRQWTGLLGVKRLPHDHWAVFKSLTKYSYTSLDRVQEELGLEGVSRRDLPSPLCAPAIFRSIRKSVVVKHKEPYGIPQGSAMSALLSNISMIDFDSKLSKFIQCDCSGYYRRYSDDILIIVALDDEKKVKKFISETLPQTTGSFLNLNDDKEVVSKFSVSEGGELKCDVPVDYLGFTFDGYKTRVRSSSLSRYYRKMIQKVRAAKNRAYKSAKKGNDGRLYKRKIYRMFSHLAKRQRNFITYAQMSNNKVDNSGVKSQLSKHWKRLQKEINKAR
ncbi:MAG: antiviral reverse transcriptase Drt2 [Pseudomonadota bacterium]|nr:antiviral reverse transcriptase Drt2 [Pseudomonadota bacterium]